MVRMSGSFSPSRAEERGDDLRVVEVAFGEERAQRAVRHAAVRISFSRGAAFALEVAAGDLADGRRFFAVIDGEREPVLAFLDLGGGDGGDDDDGFAAADGDGAVGELGEFAGFDGDFVGADAARDVMDAMVW